MAKATKADVVKAWSERAGREDQYDVREVEDFEGRKQTQLIDKDTGSISIAVDGTGADAYQRLLDNVGAALLDDGIAPKESTSVDSETQTTSRGVLATPTQPEATNDPANPVVVVPGETGADVPTHRDPTTGGTALGSTEASDKDPNEVAKDVTEKELAANKEATGDSRE